MKRVLFIITAVAMFAAVGCEEVIVELDMDKAYIAFYEDQMTVPAEGGEFYVPVNSTGIDNASLHESSDFVQDENGDLLPVEKDEWIEIVMVINEYDREAEATRALAKWDSAILIRVQPNNTGHSRDASLSASTFSKSDHIIIRQEAMAE
ncbi:MAG: hypothetical protein IJX40_05510 [Alistipes sp.]|nr:hypothetical protein [Alistipes sp.]